MRPVLVEREGYRIRLTPVINNGWSATIERREGRVWRAIHMLPTFFETEEKAIRAADRDIKIAKGAK
jgi:hypothetical protein